MWMGKTLQVATPGHYIALVSTVKENADPAADVARPAASPSRPDDSVPGLPHVIPIEGMQALISYQD